MFQRKNNKIFNSTTEIYIFQIKLKHLFFLTDRMIRLRKSMNLSIQKRLASRYVIDLNNYQWNMDHNLA